MFRTRQLKSILSGTRSFVTTTYPLSHIGKAPIYFSGDVSLSVLPERHDEGVPIPTYFNYPAPEQPIEPLTSRARKGLLGKVPATLVVKGPLGEERVGLHPFVHLGVAAEVTEAGNRALSVKVADARVKTQRAMWGTTRALINNAVLGVTDGYTLPIRLVGVGYRANLEDNDTRIGLKLGYSHPISVPIPEGVKVLIPSPTKIILSSKDKQALGQFAAVIRKWRKPEPYNQKGIFVGDEVIKKKEGKKK